MRRLFTFCVLIIISQMGYSQEFLKPSSGYFSNWEYEDTYYSSLRELIIKNQGSNPIARIIVLPSFEPEYVLSVDKNIDGTNVLTKRTLSESCFYSTNRSSIQITETSTILDDNLSNLIHTRLKTSILNTRYYEDEYEVFDGTRYIFICFVLGQGLISGETHSPKKGSKMGALVKLSEDIAKLTDESSKESTRLRIIEELEKPD